MPEQVGVLDYYGARQIRDRDIDVVVVSYFADPANTLHVMADDVLVDVARAIKASAYAKLMLASDDASEDQKRQAVWNAVLGIKPSWTDCRHHVSKSVVDPVFACSCDQYVRTMS